jgi:hypothetical protein
MVLVFAMAAALARAESEPLPPAFDRIVHGWTNYSTAFNATHDTGAGGDYASIGTFYSPTAPVTPLEYGVIVIWTGQRAPDWSKFRYRVFLWSSLDEFIREPTQGDVATWEFANSGSDSVESGMPGSG